MQALLKVKHGLILMILAIAGIEVFVAYYLWQISALGALLDSDSSGVSLIILALYLLVSLFFIALGWSNSKIINDSWSEEHENPLLIRFAAQLKQKPQALSELLEVLETRLRGRYSFGFFIADLMLKLGLLGTVIGFIIMLGSLSNLNSIDITVMQKLLVEMSGGMRVALYTTLSGMLTGILLNFKFNLLDLSSDYLLNDLKERYCGSQHDS